MRSIPPRRPRASTTVTLPMLVALFALAALIALAAYLFRPPPGATMTPAEMKQDPTELLKRLRDLYVSETGYVPFGEIVSDSDALVVEVDAYLSAPQGESTPTPPSSPAEANAPAPEGGEAKAKPQLCRCGHVDNRHTLHGDCSLCGCCSFQPADSPPPAPEPTPPVEQAPPVDHSRVVTAKGRVLTLHNEVCEPDAASCWAVCGNAVAYIDDDGKVTRDDEYTATQVLCGYDVFGPNAWPLPPGTAERLDAYFDSLEPKAPPPVDREGQGGRVPYDAASWPKVDVWIRHCVWLDGTRYFVWGITPSHVRHGLDNFSDWTELADDYELSLDGGLTWQPASLPGKAGGE